MDQPTSAPPAATPVAVVDRVSPVIDRRTRQVRTWLLHVACPNACKGGHSHGSGGPDLHADAGHRGAHCVPSRKMPRESIRDYVVVIPEAIIARAYADLAKRGAA